MSLWAPNLKLPGLNGDEGMGIPSHDLRFHAGSLVLPVPALPAQLVP